MLLYNNSYNFIHTTKFYVTLNWPRAIGVGVVGLIVFASNSWKRIRKKEEGESKIRQEEMLVTSTKRKRERERERERAIAKSFAIFGKFRDHHFLLLEERN